MYATNGHRVHSRDLLPDYYALLGVDENASFHEIEAAYWREAYKADSRTILPLLNQAYEVLGDKDQRAEYNAKRKAEQDARS